MSVGALSGRGVFRALRRDSRRFGIREGCTDEERGVREGRDEVLQAAIAALSAP